MLSLWMWTSKTEVRFILYCSSYMVSRCSFSMWANQARQTCCAWLWSLSWLDKLKRIHTTATTVVKFWLDAGSLGDVCFSSSNNRWQSPLSSTCQDSVRAGLKHMFQARMRGFFPPSFEFVQESGLLILSRLRGGLRHGEAAEAGFLSLGRKSRTDTGGRGCQSSLLWKAW